MQVLNFRHTRPTSNTLLQPKNYLYGCYKAVKWCDTILIPFYLVSAPTVQTCSCVILFLPVHFSNYELASHSFILAFFNQNTFENQKITI